MNILLEQCMIAPGLGGEDLTKIGDIWWKTCIEKRIGQGYGGAANHIRRGSFMNREGNHSVERQKFRQLAEKYKLDLVLLFGSYVRKGGPPPNDIDIAVRGNRILSEREKIEITYELCNIFQVNHIDVVDIKTAPLLLKREIFKEFKVLYERDPMLLYQLELASLYEFNEAKILHTLRRERLEEFIK